MYFIVTNRPDIAYPIGKFSKRNHNPCTHDSIAVKRTIRYVNDPQDFGVIFDGSNPLIIDSFSDAD